jgi:hypothetical protein
MCPSPTVGQSRTISISTAAVKCFSLNNFSFDFLSSEYNLIVMASTILAPDVEANAGNKELEDNTIIVVLGTSRDLAQKKTLRFSSFKFLSRASIHVFA